ncbi:MAG: terminase small subunit [Candidatus Paceibacterota bacterium]|jgi:hypothetical protein
MEAIQPQPTIVESSKHLCKRSGCEKALMQSQKTYCSRGCRNTDISEGNGPHPETKYRPEFSSKILELYLKKCEEGNNPTISDAGVVLQNAKLPSKEGYAKYLKVHPRTLDLWQDNFPDFTDAMSSLKAEQKEFLINHGLAGRYNASIAKLLLANNHGMTEKKEEFDKSNMFGIVKQVYEESERLMALKYGSKSRSG